MNVVFSRNALPHASKLEVTAVRILGGICGTAGVMLVDMAIPTLSKNPCHAENSAPQLDLLLLNVSPSRTTIASESPCPPRIIHPFGGSGAKSASAARPT